jgi:ABC-type amino acid transport substrate-binding protein
MSKEADLFFGSAIWLENPKKFIYSNTIMPHVSYMYSTKKFQDQFSLNAHNGALICTRRAYSYPLLQPYFDDGKLVRVDSSSQQSIVNMLSKERCDFAVMSEENARGVMFDSVFCQSEFYQSPLPVMSDEVGFIINENLTQTRNKINQQLLTFINSGARDMSIQKHLKSRVFPKRACEQTAGNGLATEN